MLNPDLTRLEDPIRPLGPSKRQIAEQAEREKAAEPVPARGTWTGIAPKGFVVTPDGWLGTDTTPPAGKPPESDAAKVAVCTFDDFSAATSRAMARGVSSGQMLAAIESQRDDATWAESVAMIDALEVRDEPPEPPGGPFPTFSDEASAAGRASARGVHTKQILAACASIPRTLYADRIAAINALEAS